MGPYKRGSKQLEEMKSMRKKIRQASISVNDQTSIISLKDEIKDAEDKNKDY